MPISEVEINIVIAQILSELGLDCRAERTIGRARPDIRCVYKGFKIGLETSYSRRDAEKDAKKRVEQGLVDIAIALHITERFPDVPEKELIRLIRNAKYSAKIFVPMKPEGLLKYIVSMQKIIISPERWLENVDIPMLKTLIETSIRYLVEEKEVVKAVENVKSCVQRFIESACSLPSRDALTKAIYDVLYRLHGISFAEAKDAAVILGQAALALLLSAVFYEHVRVEHGLPSLNAYISRNGPIKGLRNALEDLLKIDYKTALEVAIEILDALDPKLSWRVRDLVNLAERISQDPALLMRDFAGRVYHEITGDIALKKGFATFYTEIPAAYLLADLAIHSLADLDKKRICDISCEDAEHLFKGIHGIRIGDLACGSGTLLTASCYALQRLLTNLAFYHYIKIDPGEIGKDIIEKSIYGIDALRYACQITAINLSFMSIKPITKQNVYTIYLGYMPNKGAWLGSLEFLMDSERVGGILAYIEGGAPVSKITVREERDVLELPRRFNLVIMNPPFTRPTGRRGQKFESIKGERGRRFFGFIASDVARSKLLKRLEKVRLKVKRDLVELAKSLSNSAPQHIQQLLKGENDYRAFHNLGQAGEGVLFLYLAHKLTRSKDVIAFVLPRNLLSSSSWFLARAMLLSNYHIKYIIVSHDPEGGYNFSEGTSLSECLLVAKKDDKSKNDYETCFVILHKKPKTALEALTIAEKIREASREDASSINNMATVLKIPRYKLLRKLHNWGFYSATGDITLMNHVEKLEEGVLVVGDIQVNIPVLRLGDLLKDISKIGAYLTTLASLPIRGNKIDCKGLSRKIAGGIPMLCGGGEEVRSRICVEPNAWFKAPEDKNKKKAIEDSLAKFLLPRRIWWPTTGATAVWAKEPLISNLFFSAKLNEGDERYEKILTLWLNTTWGILSMLLYREETRGPFSEFSIPQWRLLPVLNVSKLGEGTVNKLIKLFDSCAQKALTRIPRQFSNDLKKVDPVRLEIDLGFLKAMNPDINPIIAKKELSKLYGAINDFLSTWIS